MLSQRLQAVSPDPIYAADPSDNVVAPLLDLDPDLAAGLTPALREQVRGCGRCRAATGRRTPRASPG